MAQIKSPKNVFGCLGLIFVSLGALLILTVRTLGSPETLPQVGGLLTTLIGSAFLIAARQAP